jgi:hypothetical protein
MLHFPRTDWESLITLQLSQYYLIQAVIRLGTWDASISREYPSIASNIYGYVSQKKWRQQSDWKRGSAPSLQGAMEDAGVIKLM